MSKRTFAQIEQSSPTSSPLKRFHTSTPVSRSTASTAFSTPYTPSIYSTPADSPTNPLGLKRRVNNLTLPKATPFSKHIALRFQLIAPSDVLPSKPSPWPTPPDSSSSPLALHSKNPAAAGYACEGTYRVVQVPLSYTFRHLHALILFLFSGDPTVAPRPPGHLFVVHHGILTRPRGEISRGRVRVKLSRARDPYYSSRSLADLIAAADAQGQGEEDLEDEEEDASWRWEGEDDFTLGHVWEVRSRDPKRAIIYNHDDKTTIHITLNTQTVPHRKGVGNMPFVFRAYGAVHIDSPPPRSSSDPDALPTTPLPTPASRIFPAYKRRAATRPSDGPGDTDIDDDYQNGSSSDEDDFDGGLNTSVWNHIGAFHRFLSLVRARAISSSSASSASPSPSPSVPPSPSSPIRAHTASSSSPTRNTRRSSTMPYYTRGPRASTSSATSLSLLLPVAGTSTTSLSLSSSRPPKHKQQQQSSSSTTNASSPSPARSMPSLTPAPARVRTRYRVARAARRLLGLTERGLQSAAAEEGDGVEGRAAPSQGGGSKRVIDVKKEKGKGKYRIPATKRGTANGDPSEVWNPFAHLKDIS